MNDKIRDTNMYFYYKKDRLNQLRGFCTTVQNNCIAKEAAKKLGVEPAAVSKQIQALERDIGITLINRTKSTRISLTEEGKKFYESAIVCLQQIDNLFKDYNKNLKDEEEKKLIIGTNSFILNKIVNTITRFKENYSETKIEIVFFDNETSLKSVANKQIDVFISSIEKNEKLDNKLDFIELADYIPYWVLWKGHPLENKDVLTKDDVLNTAMCFDRNNISSESLKIFLKTYDIKTLVDISNASVDTYKTLIKNKFGITLIFDAFLTEEDSKYFVFKNATNLFPSGKYGCFVNKFCKNVTKQFINYLLEDGKITFKYDFIVKCCR